MQCKKLTFNHLKNESITFLLIIILLFTVLSILSLINVLQFIIHIHLLLRIIEIGNLEIWQYCKVFGCVAYLFFKSFYSFILVI